MCTLVRCSYHAKQFNDKKSIGSECSGDEKCTVVKCRLPSKAADRISCIDNDLNRKKDDTYRWTFFPHEQIYEDDWRTYTVHCHAEFDVIKNRWEHLHEYFRFTGIIKYGEYLPHHVFEAEVRHQVEKFLSRERIEWIDKVNKFKEDRRGKPYKHFPYKVYPAMACDFY